MKSLQDFASNDNQQLFVQAKTLPQFFHHNLVDPARVVKAFKNDPQANIRIFYYQYLKLCFQLDNVNYEFYINKIQQIINNQDFKFIFYEDDDPSLFSDLQFKNLIMQFFGVLGDGNITIDAALNRFPVMDTVFIYFFRAFLILTGKAENLDSFIERDQLLQYLCTHFQVEITVHDRCIKFVETDIFAYEQDPKQVFMAFMDYDKVQNESQLQPPQQDIPQYIQENHQNQRYAPKEQEPISMPHPYINKQQEQPYQMNNAREFEQMYNLPKVKLQVQSQPPQNMINYPASNNSSSRRDNNQVNQSYIASEFVDYTSGNNYNFGSGSGSDAKGSLKDSGSVDIFKHNQQSSIKADQFGYNFEQISKKPASKPSAYKLEQESQGIYGGYESKSNTSYNYSELDKLTSQNSNNMGSYVSKTNFNVDVPGIKKLEFEENKFIPQKDWEPTKDPGFTQKYTTNQYSSSTSYQKPVSPTSYQPISNTYYDQTDYSKTLQKNKPSSQSLHTSDSLPQLEVKKPVSPEGITNQAIPSYTSAYQSSYQNTYTPTYQSNSAFQNQYNAPVPVPKPSSSKSPFGLNVSLEFTNSFTMKAMNEPYRSSVSSIRQRARNFRNSLVSYIK